MAVHFKLYRQAISYNVFDVYKVSRKAGLGRSAEWMELDTLSQAMPQIQSLHHIDEKYTSPSWVCPCSDNSTSSMLRIPHLGQIIFFSKQGRSCFGRNEIFPTSQSKYLLHPLHLKLSSVILLPFMAAIIICNHNYSPTQPDGINGSPLAHLESHRAYDARSSAL